MSAFHLASRHGYGSLVHVPSAEGTAVTDPSGDTPLRFCLEANVPNPFNPSTVISYTVPAGTSAGNVQLKIFDISGRLVRTLVDESQRPGVYTVTWNGVDQFGAPVASGVYLYRLQAGEQVQARKLLLVR